MSKYKPIEIGDVFSKLTVIDKAEDYIRPGNGQHEKRWRCRCECGNENYITKGTYLKIGKSTSCGCEYKEKQRQNLIRDLTGQRFGRLTAIKLINNDDFGKNKGAWWLCKCDCGKEIITKGTSLTAGYTKSCGCYSKEVLRNLQLKDLTGQKFGMLLVIKQVEDFVSPINGRHRAQWLCQCDCGNTTKVPTSYLTSGKTNSCGCYKLKRTSEVHFKDLSGQKIGMLTVIKRVEDYISPDNGRARPQFLCQCECGNQKVIQKDSLMNGTISCGCINSRGEREIAEFLRTNNIKFKIQYGFPDLVGELPLKFDFAIFNNENKLIALIEYQGEQHFEPIKFFGGDKKFDRQQLNDNAKREYCKNKNINLIEIPYWGKVEDYLSGLID